MNDEIKEIEEKWTKKHELAVKKFMGLSNKAKNRVFAKCILSPKSVSDKIKLVDKTEESIYNLKIEINGLWSDFVTAFHKEHAEKLIEKTQEEILEKGKEEFEKIKQKTEDSTNQDVKETIQE